MAQTTPKNSGYTIINGSTTGKNGAKVNTWLEYKVTQSIANNTSTIDVYLYARANTSGLSTSWDGTRSYGSITFDGSSHAGASISGYDFRSTSIYNEFAHYSQTVTHDSTGKKTITLAGTWDKGASTSTYITGGSVPSTSVTLPTIPRYATVSQSLGGKTETEITVKWSSDSTIDYVWYSKDNGSNWTAVGSVNATSGSYTISSLTADTSYNIKTRVRRKDSQLTTDSSAMAQRTYNNPYATSMPNFTIGNELTVQLYNPLGRSVTLYFIGNGTQISSTATTTGTSHKGFNTSTYISQMYATIPNSKSATYSIKVKYGSSEITMTGGTMSANASACTPTIGGLTYQDTKTATINITGNNQQIIRNQSTVRYTASSLSAKNGATISSVKVVVNGSTYNLTVSGTSATGGNAVINSGTNVTATATITDSRGYTGTKTVTVQMLDWVLPTALITLQRQNNYYTPTSLKANCTYSSLGGKNTITITYKAKKQSSSSWELTGSLTNNTAITIQCDNQYDWDVQVVITDKLGTTTYNTTLSRGTPIIFFDRQRGSTGFNGFPAIDNGVDFQGDVLPTINGKNNISYYTDTHISATNYNSIEAFYDALPSSVQTSVWCETATDTPMASGGMVTVFKEDNSYGYVVFHGTDGTYFTKRKTGGVWQSWITLMIGSLNGTNLTTSYSMTGNITMGDTSRFLTAKTYTTSSASYDDYFNFAKALCDDWIAKDTGTYVAEIIWANVTWGTAIILVQQNTYIAFEWLSPFDTIIRGQLWNNTYTATLVKQRGDLIQAIGTNISVPANTWTTICSITLPVGTASLVGSVLNLPASNNWDNGDLVSARFSGQDFVRTSCHPWGPNTGQASMCFTEHVINNSQVTVALQVWSSKAFRFTGTGRLQASMGSRWTSGN